MSPKSPRFRLLATSFFHPSLRSSSVSRTINLPSSVGMLVPDGAFAVSTTDGVGSLAECVGLSTVDLAGAANLSGAVADGERSLVLLLTVK